MSPLPTQPKDLALAPVAVEVDGNLGRLRDRPPGEVRFQLELELDTRADAAERRPRADLVLRQALREVEMRGWQADITADGARLRLSGGSVSIDLGLGAQLTDYIVNGL